MQARDAAKPLKRHAPRPIPTEGLGRRALWWVLIGITVIVPCFITVPGRDVFRGPKEFAFRGGAILLALIVTLIALFDAAAVQDFLSRCRRDLGIAALALTWTAISTATSLNPSLSLWTLLRVGVCTLYFMVAVIVLQKRRWDAVYVLLTPGVVNAVLLMLQEARLWDIYRLDQPSLRSSLVGNPNDLGSFLVIPALAAAALVASRRPKRKLDVAIAFLLGAAVVVTQSLTAVLALSAGIIAMTAVRSVKAAAISLALIVVAAAVVPVVYSPIRPRIRRTTDAIAARDYNAFASNRLTAFVAAIQMFEKRPLVGVGPGCYGWRYFDEKIEAEVRHPFLRGSADRIFNFGEAHSDYLQTLAVSGLPGFAILVGSLVMLALKTVALRNRDDDERRVFARTFAMPLAGAAGVQMIAQFPLELAASTVVMLYGAALCAAWSCE